MSDYVEVTQVDVNALAEKLNELGAKLDEKEATVLLGILSLAEKSLGTQTVPDPAGSQPDQAKKRKLTLERETIRNLNVWERLLAPRSESLWTCPGLPDPGADVINPAKS
ncbi:hypothetical protein [Cupriavidus oxalaticus]|uniref:Uncharacterized protein n=1 Tax=Cupriavidus oxalaticus TaxID=96344 RepID=A0A4P7LGP3_9BURK|nr:hypothetical protein [Cupriavidus oxalaticus]QBY55260.1 hypothetical protein E0W60_29610 [Cupriavidus oxalaticus]